MVVQGKKTNAFCIYQDLRNLHDACVNDPFPTPFTDEILENVGEREVYYFMDGFYGYHQVNFAEEDRNNATIVME